MRGRLLMLLLAVLVGAAAWDLLLIRRLWVRHRRGEVWVWAVLHALAWVYALGHFFRWPVPPVARVVEAGLMPLARLLGLAGE